MIPRRISSLSSLLSSSYGLLPLLVLSLLCLRCITNATSHQTISNCSTTDADSVDTDTTAACINEDMKYSSGSTFSDVEDVDHEDDDTCSVYIAKSTIPNAGLGVFNGNRGKQPQRLMLPFGDVCIPLIDPSWHLPAPLSIPFLDYYWNGKVFGLHYETILSESGVEVFCPGFDAIVNCHLGLKNTQVSESVPHYDYPIDMTLSHHTQGPNTATSTTTTTSHGAYTPYYNMTTTTLQYIPPYAEIFKDYGDTWFEGRHYLFGNIPLSKNFGTMSKLLRTFTNLRITQSVLQDVVTDEDEDLEDNQVLILDLFDTVVRRIEEMLQPKNTNETSDEERLAEDKLAMLIDLYDTVLHAFKELYDSRTLNALPATFQDAIFVGSDTSWYDEQHSSVNMKEYIQSQHTASLDHVREHGTCIDRIRPGKSTLVHAGRGGFATRYFRQGTVITSSPLLHMPDERVMFMYNFTKYNHEWFRDYKKKKRVQLMYNYCYGHPYSSVLLLPYGGGINLINHNQSLVNVKIEWTTRQLQFLHNTTLITHGTVADMEEDKRPQLVFQYVATRDIQPDEELFLDYGDEWEEAWQYHLEQYPYFPYDTNPSHGTTTKFISAHEYNYYHHDTFVRTMHEVSIDPYPTNIQIRCHRMMFYHGAVPHGVYEWTQKDYGLPCRILDRWVERKVLVSSNHLDLYTVQMEYVATYDVAEQDYDPTYTKKETHATQGATWVTRTDVPRSAIRFFDMPYTTEIHHPSAFRHYIQIADDMFPEQWKNL
jgi:hypothetical protein